MCDRSVEQRGRPYDGRVVSVDLRSPFVAGGALDASLVVSDEIPLRGAW